MSLIPAKGIIDVVEQMRYAIEPSHEAFQMVGNLLRNRVYQLERELEKYRHALEIVDGCRMALFDARDET